MKTKFEYKGEITPPITAGLKKLEKLFEKVEKKIIFEGVTVNYYYDKFLGHDISHVLIISNDGFSIGKTIINNYKDFEKIPRKGKGCKDLFLDKINEIEELKDKIVVYIS